MYILILPNFLHVYSKYKFLVVIWLQLVTADTCLQNQHIVSLLVYCGAEGKKGQI